eukprot:m.27666 g.27666  ORF g.27666 m.27666 type:complete len:268 (+) comp11770_c0_seq2:85-888(+)
MATPLRALYCEATQLLEQCSTDEVKQLHGQRLREVLALRLQCDQGSATAASDPGCFDVDAQQVFEQWLNLGNMPKLTAERTFVAKMVELLQTIHPNDNQAADVAKFLAKARRFTRRVALSTRFNRLSTTSDVNETSQASPASTIMALPPSLQTVPSPVYRPTTTDAIFNRAASAMQREVDELQAQITRLNAHLRQCTCQKQGLEPRPLYPSSSWRLPRLPTWLRRLVLRFYILLKRLSHAFHTVLPIPPWLTALVLAAVCYSSRPRR